MESQDIGGLMILIGFLCFVAGLFVGSMADDKQIAKEIIENGMSELHIRAGRRRRIVGHVEEEVRKDQWLKI